MIIRVSPTALMGRREALQLSARSTDKDELRSEVGQLVGTEYLAVDVQGNISRVAHQFY